MTTRINRRELLVAGLGVAGLAVVGSGCGSDSDGPGGEPASQSGPSNAQGTEPATTNTHGSGGLTSKGPNKSPLPTFKRFEPIEPDLPAQAPGVAPAYFAYPATPVKVHDSAPASGGVISAMNYAGTIPKTNNGHWQELNKRLGATLQINYAPSDQYQAKLATTLAGNDLPDLVPISPTDVAHLDDLLEAKFQDLTPWLGGDAAQNYPSLAALPTVSWKSTVFNEKIYGIPYSIPLCNPLPTLRADIVAELGVGQPNLTDGDDFQKYCLEVSDEKASRWAIVTLGDAQGMARIMADVPNIWRVEDGNFTSYYATDEYKDAISFAQRLWKSGAMNPDSPTVTSSLRSTLFLGGKDVMRMMGYITWPDLTAMGRTQNPDFDLNGIILPKLGGGGQGTYPQSGGEGPRMTAMKKASKSRVEELLRVHDWIASPFGSEEYLFIEYGQKGRDYHLTGSDPILTSTGNDEVQKMLVDNLGRAFRPIYVPGDAAMAKKEHKVMNTLLAVSFPLPTVGLVSETDLTKGKSLKKKMDDLERDIILGRKSMSDWPAGVKTWLNGGGKAITQEYEKAYARSRSD